MPLLRNAAGSLLLGGVELLSVVRDPSLGTPAYVYDLDAMHAGAERLERAFGEAPHLVAYAIKANSAGPIVRTLAAAGCGADIVSGAELALALGAGVSPEHIVYSGVAKTDAELDAAIACGPSGILAIQAESVEEIARIAARARARGRTARVSLRINPELARDTLATHAHVATGHDEAKFGIAPNDVGRAAELLRASDARLTLVGIAVHGGSQLTEVAPYVAAARVAFGVARALAASGARLAFVDAGGGFGVDYGDGAVPAPVDFVGAALDAKRAAGLDALALHVEPGRSLTAPHGVLLARVVQSKVTESAASVRRWLMIDAGMNDLLRPALYQARHRIVPLTDTNAPSCAWRVVGPVCESADDFGEHVLPAAPPDAVAILDAGAYGYSMASRYNGRALPAEVFVRGGAVTGASARAPWAAWADERLALGG